MAHYDCSRCGHRMGIGPGFCKHCSTAEEVAQLLTQDRDRKRLNLLIDVCRSFEIKFAVRWDSDQLVMDTENHENLTEAINELIIRRDP